MGEKPAEVKVQVEEQVIKAKPVDLDALLGAMDEPDTKKVE